MQGVNDSAIKVLQEELCRNIYAVIQITKDKENRRLSVFQKLSDFAEDLDIEHLAKGGAENGYN